MSYLALIPTIWSNLPCILHPLTAQWVAMRARAGTAHPPPPRSFPPLTAQWADMRAQRFTSHPLLNPSPPCIPRSVWESGKGGDGWESGNGLFKREGKGKSFWLVAGPHRAGHDYGVRVGALGRRWQRPRGVGGPKRVGLQRRRVWPAGGPKRLWPASGPRLLLCAPVPRCSLASPP